MIDKYESARLDRIDQLLHVLFAATGNKWTYDKDSETISALWDDGTYYSHLMRYMLLDGDITDYARTIVSEAKRHGFLILQSTTIVPDKAIITITPAMIERLIDDGLIKVEGLTGNATIERFWLRQDVSPSGDICMVVSGEGLPHTCLGGQLPFASVEIKALINT